MMQLEFRVRNITYVIYLEFNEIIGELNARLEEHKEKAKKLIEASK
jgi:hypothetical protein